MDNKKVSTRGCKLWVGMSGYSYAEWADAGFYPPGTWLWIIGSFSTALVFSILAIILPMRFDDNRLSKLKI